MRGTFYTVFILRRLQEEYHVRGKMLYMCFVCLVKALDSVPRKVLEWALRKKGIPEVLGRSMMSLYEEAKTRIRVDSELSEQFRVKEGFYHGSLLSPFFLSVVVDVVTEFSREGALNELLYTGDLVLMSMVIEGLSNRFIEWKEVLESIGLKVSLGKTKLMVSSSITKDGLSKSRVDPCGVCCLRVKTKSVLCLQCGK